MKLLEVTLMIALIFAGFAYAQKENSTIKPVKSYKQSGAKIFSPNQTGWQLVKSESLETVFGRNNSEAKYNAFSRTKTIPVYENVADLFENLEKIKQSELNSLNRDSLHYNRTDFKATPCLQYDGIFNNDTAATPGYKYFNFNGYLCRHPKDKTIAIQIEFSNYSNIRGFSEDELRLGKEFLEKIQFSKVNRN